MTADGRGSKDCPTLTRKKILAEANKEYNTAETLKFAHTASVQEAIDRSGHAGVTLRTA